MCSMGQLCMELYRHKHLCVHVQCRRVVQLIAIDELDCDSCDPSCTAGHAHRSWITNIGKPPCNILPKPGRDVTLPSSTLSSPHLLQPRRLQQIRNSPRQRPSIDRQLHQTPKRLQHCRLCSPRRPPWPPTNLQRCCITSAIVQRQPGWQRSI
jgi:hypothetical protein